jgi:hypothetical protein
MFVTCYIHRESQRIGWKSGDFKAVNFNHLTTCIDRIERMPKSVLPHVSTELNACQSQYSEKEQPYTLALGTRSSGQTLISDLGRKLLFCRKLYDPYLNAISTFDTLRVGSRHSSIRIIVFNNPLTMCQPDVTPDLRGTIVPNSDSDPLRKLQNCLSMFILFKIWLGQHSDDNVPRRYQDHNA